MEMQQVRYFLAVARTLNFTRAAEACNVTQPALTRAIKTLEDELGGPLLLREGRLTHLTPLGERMRPYLANCYENAEAAKSVATALSKGEAAALALAIAHSVDVALLLPPLAEMFRAFPGLQLKVRRGSGDEVTEMLKAGRVEVAVAGSAGTGWDRLETSALFTEGFDLVVGADHPLAQRNDPAFDSDCLQGARLLLHADHGLADHELASLGAAGLALADAHEVDGVHDLEQLVAHSLGIALAPASALRAAGFRHLPVRGAPERTVSLMTAAGRPRSRALAAFLQLLKGRDWPRALSGAG